MLTDDKHIFKNHTYNYYWVINIKCQFDILLKMIRITSLTLNNIKIYYFLEKKLSYYLLYKEVSNLENPIRENQY